VEVEGDRIAGRGLGQPPREPDVQHGAVVAPGFVDLQVNGVAGREVTDGPDALDAIDAALLAHGVTSYLATLASPDDATIERAIPVLEARAADPSSPLEGLHVEGPYISPEYAGAHPPERIQPVPADVPPWLRSQAIRMVTLAPELPGAAELIAELRRLGVAVALGHSAATAWETRAAADAGAEMVTHIFNAMAPFHHREAGLAGAALTDERLMVSVIADNAHVAAPALELVRRTAGDRVILISDSTAAAAAPPGRYTMAGVEIERGEGDEVRTPDGRLAGGGLTLDDDMRGWATLTSATLAEAIRAATEVPAPLIGRTARLDAGAPADIVLLDRHGNVLRTMRRGRWIEAPGV
jgi:N-acetylglucosamine-6-phosphate deacetylase